MISVLRYDFVRLIATGRELPSNGGLPVIPASFDYHRPKSTPEALSLLGQYGDDARVVAGGHSLIPMMKLRLAQPAHLVDLCAISELKGIRFDGNAVVIGAMTTQAELLASAQLTAAVPILRETALQIADPQVRYLGTLGGNVANGDPGNDMPAVMQCLDAIYRVIGTSGARNIKAREFYKSAFVTALNSGEIVTAVEIPMPAPKHGFAYEKLKRKIGDYATAAAAVMMTVAGGKVQSCSIALTNLAPTPVYAAQASADVVGTSLDHAAITAAAGAAGALMAPSADGRGTVQFRTSVGGVMLGRALQRAFQRAGA